MNNNTEKNNYMKDAYGKLHGQKADALSMADLRVKGQDIFLEMAELRKEFDASQKQIMSDGRYSQEYRQKKNQELIAEFEENTTNIVAKFRNLANKTITAKREKLDDMLSTPPTQEQLNLLTSLRLRKANLTIGEIQRIALKLMDNYNAVKSLQAVALESGFSLILPLALDYEKLVNSLEWTEKYINDRCDDISRPWRQMSPFGRLFFGTGWGDNLYEGNSIDILDAAFQMSTPDIKIEKRSLSNSEINAVENLLKDTPGDELAEKVKSIAAESNTLRQIIETHPTYSVFLDNE